MFIPTFVPIISEIPADEVMKDKEALAFYEKGMAFFYSEIKEMNTNLYLVEQIISFPPIFIEEWLPNRFYFLLQFMNNAILMSILTIHKLISDNAEDVFTMTTFQQKIRKELLKPEHRELFQNVLKDNRQGKKEINEIKSKASEIRNKRLAHLTNTYFQQSWDKTIQQTNLDFLEIRDLSYFVNYMFFSFAFGRGYTLLPECYATVQPDQKTDIETFLDYIAQHSEILNLPESDSERWKEERSKLSNKELQDINRFRAKFNLKKV